MYSVLFYVLGASGSLAYQLPGVVEGAIHTVYTDQSDTVGSSRVNLKLQKTPLKVLCIASDNRNMTSLELGQLVTS
jgi:hypothetical protein